jgi:hypothetical protein
MVDCRQLQWKRGQGKDTKIEKRRWPRARGVEFVEKATWLVRMYILTGSKLDYGSCITDANMI